MGKRRIYNMSKKIYAVKEGYDFSKGLKVENKILNSWDECVKYVKGVKGAKYKSFSSLREAEEYLGMGDPLLRKGGSNYPVNQLHAYVDGSYNEEEGKYSYGIVMVKDDVIDYIENGSAADDREKDIRQIGGELSAAIKSVEYCIRNNIDELVIVHDYEGVCYHATGYWERREESSKKYFETMNTLIRSSNIKLTFLKVDSHTGDLFNEAADEFAKEAAGIKIKGEVRKYLKNKIIMVSDGELKKRFLPLVGEELLDKIKVV
jgi:ribonuclease H-related protein